jgi:hypothetical protein
VVQARFDEALRVLARHEVELVVVGGIAAILQGSPLTTDDLDLVYRVSDENCRRLHAALQELDAVYADPAGREIRPSLERLEKQRVHLLNTSCGRVDLMRTVGDDLAYPQVARRSRKMDVEEMTVRVLDLEAIIETKEQADRPKDRYQLPFLRQLLTEIRRRGEG